MVTHTYNLATQEITVLGQLGKKLVKPHLNQQLGTVFIPVIPAVWEVKIGRSWSRLAGT
jgi:hypothetical protein